MSSNCIDLTEDEPVITSKRNVASIDADEDCDVCIVIPSPKRRCDLAVVSGPLGDDEDLQITGDTGGLVVLKDLPHSRSQCGHCAFNAAAPTTSNAAACPQCFCHVCDVQAAQCSMWGSGASTSDHCNAHSSKYWQAIRTMRRSGDAAGVRAAFDRSFNPIVPPAAVLRQGLLVGFNSRPAGPPPGQHLPGLLPAFNQKGLLPVPRAPAAAVAAARTAVGGGAAVADPGLNLLNHIHGSARNGLDRNPTASASGDPDLPRYVWPGSEGAPPLFRGNVGIRAPLAAAVPRPAVVAPRSGPPPQPLAAAPPVATAGRGPPVAAAAPLVPLVGSRVPPAGNPAQHVTNTHMPPRGTPVPPAAAPSAQAPAPPRGTAAPPAPAAAPPVPAIAPPAGGAPPSAVEHPPPLPCLGNVPMELAPHYIIEALVCIARSAVPSPHLFTTAIPLVLQFLPRLTGVQAAHLLWSYSIVQAPNASGVQRALATHIIAQLSSMTWTDLSLAAWCSTNAAGQEHTSVLLAAAIVFMSRVPHCSGLQLQNLALCYARTREQQPVVFAAVPHLFAVVHARAEFLTRQGGVTSSEELAALQATLSITKPILQSGPLPLTPATALLAKPPVAAVIPSKQPVSCSAVGADHVQANV